VNITPDMVTAELQRNAEGANKVHYHVLEIFLPVENPEQNEKVKKDAEEVERQLHTGAPFPVVARQFSQHPTAATGGDMGWVSDGQLAAELNTTISKMEVGAISDPVRSTGGWYIGPARAPGANGHQDRRGANGPDRAGRHFAAGASAVSGRSPRTQGPARADHEGGRADS
jgi:peptidyl-prolyl cis-trans isomerase SurA